MPDSILPRGRSDGLGGVSASSLWVRTAKAPLHPQNRGQDANANPIKKQAKPRGSKPVEILRSPQETEFKGYKAPGKAMCRLLWSIHSAVWVRRRSKARGQALAEAPLAPSPSSSSHRDAQQARNHQLPPSAPHPAQGTLRCPNAKRPGATPMRPLLHRHVPSAAQACPAGSALHHGAFSTVSTFPAEAPNPSCSQQPWPRSRR